MCLGIDVAVVLPGCDAATAATIADELRLAVPGDSTCSIGLATWDGEESSVDLVARADAALYAAKRDGRDRVAVSRA